MNTCQACAIEFVPRPGRPDQPYCSRPCYWEAARGRQRITEGVRHRMRSAKGHPIAPPSGVVAVARLNLYDKIGPGEHKCNWCNKMVDWAAGRHSENELIADHLNWDATDDSPENLVPTCNPCNAHRRKNGRSKILTAKDTTRAWGGAETRGFRRYCNHCGKQFIAVPAEAKNPGKARFCSRGCGYADRRARNLNPVGREKV
jgi:hypothetical protein